MDMQEMEQLLLPFFNSYVLSVDDIKTALAMFGHDITDNEVGEVMKDDGAVDFYSFLEVAGRKFSEKEDENKVIGAFRLFDTDNTGTVRVADLRRLLSEELVELSSLSSEEVEEMISEASMSSDGRICYNEFVLRLLSQS
jgi:Ca2+-binding EF-hand superfamily protein